jgi:[CysO sulfur-carrier protein]-S-L-cysteine hydrolase
VVSEDPKGMPTSDDWADAAKTGTDARHAAAETSPSFEATNASLPADLLQAIIDAAREGLPNEACGLLVAATYAGDGGAPTRYVPLRNAAESPYRYVIDPQEQLEVWMALEDSAEVPWGIVHSHVASPAVPSVTDIGLAFFPESLYLVCSLMDEMPTVRAWKIRDGVVTEVQLAVTEDGATDSSS